MGDSRQIVGGFFDLGRQAREEFAGVSMSGVTVERRFSNFCVNGTGRLAHAEEEGDQNDRLKQHRHRDHGDKIKLKGLIVELLHRNDLAQKLCRVSD